MLVCLSLIVTFLCLNVLTLTNTSQKIQQICQLRIYVTCNVHFTFTWWIAQFWFFKMLCDADRKYVCFLYIYNNLQLMTNWRNLWSQKSGLQRCKMHWTDSEGGTMACIGGVKIKHLNYFFYIFISVLHIQKGAATPLSYMQCARCI